jgi:hypothetical protein
LHLIAVKKASQLLDRCLRGMPSRLGWASTIACALDLARDQNLRGRRLLSAQRTADRSNGSVRRVSKLG